MGGAFPRGTLNGWLRVSIMRLLWASGLCLLSAPVLAQQQQTFGAASFSPPVGWSADLRPAMQSYARIRGQHRCMVLISASEPARRTRYQLIDDALAAKRINEETAHKYRVFAGFGDSRLPAQYRGRDAGFELPREVLKVGELLTTFSPQTRAELAPFFTRPEEPGSWVTLATVSGQAPEGSAPPNGERLSLGEATRAGLAMRVAGFPTTNGLRSVGAMPVSVSSTASHSAGWQSFMAANGKAKV